MEVLPDEKKETTAAFLRRALLQFQAQGVTVCKLLTDNGSPYRSKAFKASPAHLLDALVPPPMETDTFAWPPADVLDIIAERFQELSEWPGLCALLMPRWERLCHEGLRSGLRTVHWEELARHARNTRQDALAEAWSRRPKEAAEPATR